MTKRYDVVAQVPLHLNDEQQAEVDSICADYNCFESYGGNIKCESFLVDQIKLKVRSRIAQAGLGRYEELLPPVDEQHDAAWAKAAAEQEYLNRRLQDGLS